MRPRKGPPVLTTRRLRLRPFRLSDAASVVLLAGDAEVASTTASIPHPYHREHALAWIALQETKFRAETEVVYAITRRIAGRSLVGAMGLVLNLEQSRAELGYWIGKPYWGKGYATEAARAVIRYGFEALALNRIFAHHMTRNPASGRVLEKAGMKYEGTLRRHFLKWGTFEDAKIYGILHGEFKR